MNDDEPVIEDLPLGGAIASGFKSFEAMQAWMGRQEDEANANVVSAQREITWGDYVIRLVPTLVIWGRIYGKQEIYDIERKYYADPFEEGEQEEFEYTINVLEDSHARGYRYGWWSSEIESGEPGDAHISTLWKISKSDYEIAQRNGWKLWPELALRLKADFTAAKRERDEQTGQGGPQGPR